MYFLKGKRILSFAGKPIGDGSGIGLLIKFML